MALQAVKKFRLKELRSVRLSKSSHAPNSPQPHALPNPFIPRLNPQTGRWAPPKYSLRQQADLIKQAQRTNTLGLLPASVKLPLSELRKATDFLTSSPVLATEEWAAPVIWEGEVKERIVKGADIGNRLYAGKKRMFKGHKWERLMKRKKAYRTMLMRDMRSRVKKFKNVHRTSRPHPLRPARSTKFSKLPI